MAKPLAPAFVHTATTMEPMTERLAVAIERRRAVGCDDEPTDPFQKQEPPPAGMEPCDSCGVLVQRKSNHYGVHFPNKDTTKPCARSWPPKRKR